MKVKVGNKTYTTRTSANRPRLFFKKDSKVEYLELTKDKNLTTSGNKFFVIINNVKHWVREKFNITSTVSVCAKTTNPRASSRVYSVSNYSIPSRGVNLSKLKIDVTVSTAGSHKNDGDKIAKGYVTLEAYENGVRKFSKKIWEDQTNGGDGASGFEAGTVFNKKISEIMGNNASDVYDLRVSIYLSTGDYQAHVDGGQHRYQRVHGICVTVYD